MPEGKGRGAKGELGEGGASPASKSQRVKKGKSPEKRKSVERANRGQWGKKKERRNVVWGGTGDKISVRLPAHQRGGVNNRGSTMGNSHWGPGRYLRGVKGGDGSLREAGKGGQRKKRE